MIGREPDELSADRKTGPQQDVADVQADCGCSANGPLDTSGPRRSLRVREIAPMWCTAQSRMASPIATISAPMIHNDAPGASGRRGNSQKSGDKRQRQPCPLPEQPATKAGREGQRFQIIM